MLTSVDIMHEHNHYCITSICIYAIGMSLMGCHKKIPISLQLSNSVMVSSKVSLNQHKQNSNNITVHLHN